MPIFKFVNQALYFTTLYPRQESNLRAWLRRPSLYPLSYGGISDAANLGMKIVKNKWKLSCHILVYFNLLTLNFPRI
jgi:hypothetical protein